VIDHAGAGDIPRAARRPNDFDPVIPRREIGAREFIS
jgi:hypothetical protein